MTNPQPAAVPVIQAEAAHLAAWHAIYGPHADPFQSPEGYDFCCQVADAVAAAIRETPNVE